jgi:hypothetical protein
VPRVGIDGEPAGAVTPDEEAVAKARLAELAKGAAPAVIPPKPPPTAQTAPNTPTLTPVSEGVRDGAAGRVAKRDLATGGARIGCPLYPA